MPRPQLLQAQILTPSATDFIVDLQRTFNGRRKELLAQRKVFQAKIDSGEATFDFLPETQVVRDGHWNVAPLPPFLFDRRVEITGPTDRKMVINALNSGANVFMADFEDSTAPTFSNLLEGQASLTEAVYGTLSYVSPEGKQYRLKENVATLFVRPRGWHLPEQHIVVDGEPMSASLFDFGLFFFHNARELVDRGFTPCFYLPKLEHHLEARLWNDVFLRAQEKLGLPRGTTKATVLIETLPAAFQMEEILYELREHSAGLNCGRWDYIFSFIKKFSASEDAMMPDRSALSMDRGFLRAYTLLLIKTCHKRGVHAMGGMAAQIPVKDDPQANEAALAKVRADKLREVTDGHDGTWVAHPALVAIAKEIFDAHLPTPNQIFKQRDDVQIGRDELLAIPEGARTEEGLRHNIRVGVQYIEAWLRGVGCVPLYHLMEDAATAEIARAQVWQQVKYQAVLDGTTPLTVGRFDQVFSEEMRRIRTERGERAFLIGRFDEAAALFRELSLDAEFADFLTLPAYTRLVRTGQ